MCHLAVLVRKFMNNTFSVTVEFCIWLHTLAVPQLGFVVLVVWVFI